MFGFSRFFGFTSFLFALNQGVEKAGYFIPFVHSYLDDLLCPGIVLGFALFVQQQFTYRLATYRLPIGQIGFFVVWYSLLFEVLFPLFDNRHYSDPWDILAYSTGAFLFIIFGNKEVSRIWLSPRLIQKTG